MAAGKATAQNAFIMSMEVLGLDKLRAVRQELTAIDRLGRKISKQPIAGGGAATGGTVIAGGTKRPSIKAGGTKTTVAGQKNLFAQADFTTVARRVFMWGTATMVIYRTIRAISDAVSVTRELETQMVQLKKVMPTESNFRVIREGFFGIAQTYGESVLEVARVGKIFAQTGLKQNEVLKMTRAAMLGVNSANLTAAESVEFLISAQRAYNMEIEKTPLLLDKIMKVQANYAIEARELAMAFQRGASTFKLVGLSPDVLFGYVTAVKEITRESPETIVRGLRTTLMKTLRPEGMEAFRKVGITGLGKTKTIFDAYTELAEKLKKGEITPAKMREITASIIDIRQARHFIALMENYDRALGAITDSQTAYNDAQRANLEQMETLDKRISVATEHWKEFSISFVENSIKPSLEILVELVGQLGAGLANLSQTGLGKDVLGGGALMGTAFGMYGISNLLSGGRLGQGLGTLKRGGFKWSEGAGGAYGYGTRMGTMETLGRGMLPIGGLLLKAAPYITIAMAIARVVRHMQEWRGEQALFNVEFQKTIDMESIATKDFEDFFGTIDEGIEKSSKIAQAIIAWEQGGRTVATVKDLADAMRAYGIEVKDVTTLQELFTAAQRFWQWELYGNIERLKASFDELQVSLVDIYSAGAGETLLAPGGLNDWLRGLQNLLPDRIKDMIPAKLDIADDVSKMLIAEVGEIDKQLQGFVQTHYGARKGEIIGFLLTPSEHVSNEVVKQGRELTYKYIKEMVLTKSEFRNLRARLGLSSTDLGERGLEQVQAIVAQVLRDLVPEIAEAEMGSQRWLEYITLISKTLQDSFGGGSDFLNEFIFRLDEVNDSLFDLINSFNTQLKIINATEETMKALGRGYDKGSAQMNLYADTMTKLNQIGFENEEQINKVKHALELVGLVEGAQLREYEKLWSSIGGSAYDKYLEAMEVSDASGIVEGSINDLKSELTFQLQKLQYENWEAIFERFGGTQETLGAVLMDKLGLSKEKIRELLSGTAQEFIADVNDILRIRYIQNMLTDLRRERKIQRLQYGLDVTQALSQYPVDVNTAIRGTERPEDRLANFREQLRLIQTQHDLELETLNLRKQDGKFAAQEGEDELKLYMLARDEIDQKYKMLELEEQSNYALKARTEYVDAYMDNVKELQSLLTNTFSDLESWFDSMFGEKGAKALPFLDLLKGIGKIYSGNVAEQLSQSIVSLFNFETLGNVLGAGNTRLKAYAMGGEAMISEAQKEILAGKDVLQNKSLTIEQQQLDVLRDIYLYGAGAGGPALDGTTGTMEDLDDVGRKQLWATLAAQGGMMGGMYLGGAVGGRSDFVSTGTSLGSMIASKASLGPWGVLAGGLLGGLLGGLFSPKDKVAEDIHEIRVNTNTLKDISEEFINLPTRFTMPVTSGFYGGQSRGGSVSVYVTTNNGKAVVKEIEKAYGSSQNRSGSKHQVL